MRAIYALSKTCKLSNNIIRIVGESNSAFSTRGRANTLHWTEVKRRSYRNSVPFEPGEGGAKFFKAGTVYDSIGKGSVDGQQAQRD